MHNIAYAYCMHNKYKGFTAVEILIVVTIVAILAGIGIMGLSGFASSARNEAREQDTEAWIAAFESYKSRFSAFPLLPTSSLAPKTVCLGVFTNNKCGQNNSSVPTRFINASGADYTAIRTEVARVGNVYVNSGSPITVLGGPIVYISRTADSGPVTVNAQFINFFEGNCPTGYTNISATLPASIALVLTSVTANACAKTKYFSYTI